MRDSVTELMITIARCRLATPAQRGEARTAALLLGGWSAFLDAIRP